jgi:hypothetical protein
MAQPTPEMLARMVAHDVYEYSGGAPSWVLLHTVARRIEIFDRALIDAAAKHAVTLGYLEIEPANAPWHARLTALGLQSFRPAKIRGLQRRVPHEGGRGSLAKRGAQRALQRDLARLGRRGPPKRPVQEPAPDQAQAAPPVRAE